MSAVQWRPELDEQRTQAVPGRQARRSNGGQAAVRDRPVPLRTMPYETPRGRYSTAQFAAETEPVFPLPALPRLPALSKIFTTVAAIGVLAILLYFGITSLIAWTQVKLDDMHYGRPRTYQTDAYVGHNEAAGSPTHFVAMNLNRRVTIVEFPGGDVSKPQVIAGPYLFGRAEDLTVVKVRVGDVNGDDKPDLTVHVKDERLVYINDGAAFRPITTEELNQLKAKEGVR